MRPALRGQQRLTRAQIDGGSVLKRKISAAHDSYPAYGCKSLIQGGPYASENAAER